MIGTFFMKYRFPLAYAVTKVLANHIHAAIVPVRPTKLISLKTRPIDIGREHTPAERTECIRQIAEVLPRIKSGTVIGKQSRSAAIKTGGGLRGSRATRWG